jgi:hypothetical protein
MKKINNSAKTIIVLLLSVTLGVGGTAIGAVIVQQMYPNTGEIETPTGLLALWLDSYYYANTTAINWGLCDAGTVYQFDNMTIVNTGNVAMNVSIVTYGLPLTWSLKWAKNNTQLAPSAKTEAPLNLTIPSSATSWPDWGFWLKGETT